MPTEQEIEQAIAALNAASATGVLAADRSLADLRAPIARKAIALVGPDVGRFISFRFKGFTRDTPEKDIDNNPRFYRVNLGLERDIREGK